MNTNRTSTIACPECNSPITFDVNQLIAGVKFTCSNCNATIGLSNDSKAQILNT